MLNGIKIEIISIEKVMEKAGIRGEERGEDGRR